MKRIAFLATVFSAAIVLAQQTPSLPPLSEHIDVTVVNVDVSVLDASGNPVTGLTANDFEKP